MAPSRMRCDTSLGSGSELIACPRPVIVASSEAHGSYYKPSRARPCLHSCSSHPQYFQVVGSATVRPAANIKWCSTTENHGVSNHAGTVSGGGEQDAGVEHALPARRYR